MRRKKGELRMRERLLRWKYDHMLQTRGDVISDGPRNLWNEILAFGETSFNMKELTGFIESRHKRPLLALRGKRSGGSSDIEGLVIYLLKALKRLGYLDYNMSQQTWTIRRDNQHSRSISSITKVIIDEGMNRNELG